MTRIPRALTALSVIAVLTSAAACSGGGGGGATGTPAGSAVAPSSATASTFDEQFIDMMVPHHQAAVEMAKIAEERGEHAEVKELAGEIIAAQEAEVEQLRAWRKEWFGSDETPPMSAMPMLPGMEMEMEGHSMGGTMDMTADIDELRTADPFDKAFIEAMIPHHESAITAAKLAQEQAGRPEIKELAGEIIEAQEREIAEMQGWLEAWY